MEWWHFCMLIAWWQVIMTELLPPEDTTSRRTMITTELVLNIATQNFGEAHHVMVLGSSDTLLTSLPFPILVASFDEMHKNYSLHADAVILFINNDFNYLSNVPRKWLRAYFILVPLQQWNFQSMYLKKDCTLSQNESDIEDTFSFLWQAEIANVLLLMANDSTVQAFTFNPYHLHHCQMVQAVLVEHPVFPKVKVANLQNCHLNFTFVELAPDVVMMKERTGLSKWHKRKKHSESEEGNFNVNGNNLAGVEVELVRTLAEKMNFTAYYSLPCDGSHWGYLMGNGTISGMAGDVFYRMSDVGFGHITPNLQLWHLLEYSATLGVDCYGWGIPLGAGRSIPSWKTLTSEFSTLTWGLIFLTLILSAIFMWTLSRQDARDQRRYHIPFSIFCFTCNTMIAAPMTSQPTSVAVRTFVALWLMYSIVVNVAYQAELGSIVTVPWMPPDIQDLQELLESNLQLRLPWKVHVHLEKMKDEQTSSAVKRFIPTGKVMESILELTENHREFAFLSNSKSLTYYASRSGWKFHVMTEGCMMNHHTSLILRMGSPLIPRINVLIQRFLETGLVIRWEKNYTVRSHGSRNRISGLSMPHLQGAFMALALGQSFAFLVLLVEVLFERMLPEIPPPVNKCTEAGGETEDQYVKIEEIKCPDTFSIFVSLSDSDVEPVDIKLAFESDAKEKKEKSSIPNLERSCRKKSKLGVKKQESTFVTKLDNVWRMSIYRQINEPQHFQFLNLKSNQINKMENKPAKQEYDKTTKPLLAETVNPQSMNPSGPKIKYNSAVSKKRKELKLCKIIANGPDYILTRLLQKLYIARKLLEPVINDVIDRAVCSASGCCEGQCDCSVTDEVVSKTSGTGTEETNTDCTCGDCCCCADLNNALCQEQVVPTNVETSLEMLQQLEALRSTNPKKRAAANKYFEFQNTKDLIKHLEALRDLLSMTIEGLEEGNADSVAVRKTSKTSDIPNKVSEEESSLVEYMQTHLTKLRKEYSDLCKNIQFLKDHYKDSVSLVETDKKDISSRKVASTGSIPKKHMRVTNMAGAKQLILEILGDILDFKNLLEGSSAFDRKKMYSGQKDIVNNKTKKSNSDIRGFENVGKYVGNNELYSDDEQANYDMTSKEVKHSGSSKRNGIPYSQVSLMINSRQDFIKNLKPANDPHGRQQEFHNDKLTARQPFMHSTMIDSSTAFERKKLKEKFIDRSSNTLPSIEPKGAKRSPLKEQKYQTVADKVDRRSTGAKPSPRPTIIDSKSAKRHKLKEQKYQPVAGKFDDSLSANQPFIKTPGIDYKGTDRSQSTEQKRQQVADKVEARSAGKQSFIQTPGMDYKHGDRSQSKEQKRQSVADKLENRSASNQPFIQTPGINYKDGDSPQWKEQKHQPVAHKVEGRSAGNQPFIQTPGMDYKGAISPQSKDQNGQPVTDKVGDRSARIIPFIQTPEIEYKGGDRPQSKEQKRQPVADEDRSAGNQPFIQTPGIDSKGTDRPQSKEQKRQPVADEDRSAGNQTFKHQTPGIDYNGTDRPLSKKQKPVTDKVEDRSAGNQPFIQTPGIDSKGTDRPQSKEQKHQPVAYEDRSAGNQPLIQTPVIDSKGTDRPQLKEQKRQPMTDEDRSAGKQPFIQTPGIDSKGTDRPQSKEQKRQPVADEDRSAGNLPFIQTPGIDSKGTDRPQSKEQKRQPVADENRSAGNQPFIQTPGIDYNGTDRPLSKKQKPVTDKVQDRSAGNQPFIQTPVIDSKGTGGPQSKGQKRQPVADKVEGRSAYNQPFIETPGIDSKGTDRPQSKEQKRQPVADEDRSAGSQPFIQTPGIDSKGTDRPQSKEQKRQPVTDENRSAGSQPFIQTPGIDSKGTDRPQSKEQKRQPVAVEDRSAGNQPFIQTPGIDSNGTDWPQSKEQKRQPVADEDRSAGNQPFIQTPGIDSKGTDRPQSKEQKRQPVADEDRSAGSQPFIQIPGIDSKGPDRHQSKEQKPQEVADKVEDRSAGQIQPFMQIPVIGSKGSDMPQLKEQKHQPLADKVDGRSTDNQQMIQIPIVDSNKGTERHQSEPKKQQPGTDPVETKSVPPIQDHISPGSKTSSQHLSSRGSKDSHDINAEKQMPINKDNKIEEIEQESGSILSPKTASKTPFNNESLSTLDDVSSSLSDDANPYFASESSLPIFNSPEESVSSSRQIFPNSVQLIEWLSSTGMPYIPSATSMPRLRDNVSDVLIGYIAIKPSTDMPYQPSESSLPDCPNNYARDCGRESWDSALLVGKPSFGMPYIPSISSLPQQMNQTKFNKPAFTDHKAKGRSERSMPSLSPVINLSDKRNQIDVEINHPNILVRKPSFGSPYTPSLSSLPQEIDLPESTYVKEIFVYDEPKVQSVVAKISCEIPYEASIGSLPNRTEMRSTDEEIEQKLFGRISSSEIPYVASASSLPNIFQNATGHDFLQHGNVEGLVPVRVKGDLISSAIGYISATDIVNICDIGEVKSSEISQSTHDIKPVSVLKSWPITKVNNLILKSSREDHIPQVRGSPLESVTEGKETVKHHRHSQNSSETCHLVKVQYGPVDQSNNPPGGIATSDYKAVKTFVGTCMTRYKFTERKSKSCPQKSSIKKSHLKKRNASYELRRVKTLKSFRSEGRRQSRGNMNISDRRKNRKDLNINMSRRKSKYVTISVTKSCPDSINKSVFTYFDQKKETVPVSSFPRRNNSLKSLGVMADAFILNEQMNDISRYFTVKELLKKQSTFEFVYPVENSPIIMIAGAGSTSSDLSDHRGNAPPVTSTQQSGIHYASDERMPRTISELIDLIQHVQRDETQEVCTICGVPNPLYYSPQNPKEFMDESPLPTSQDISEEPKQSSISVSQHSAGSSGSSITVQKYGELRNSKVTLSKGEKQQPATGSKKTGSRPIVSHTLGDLHNVRGISHTSKEHPEKLSTKMRKISEISELSEPNALSNHPHSQTSTVRSNLIQEHITTAHAQQNYAVPKTYEDMHSSPSQYAASSEREQNSIFSESQSRATTSSRFSNLSNPTTSGRDQSSVFSGRSGVPAVPSDLYHNSPTASAVQPNQVFPSRTTNPSVKEERSSAYSWKSVPNASRATSRFSHARSVAQENTCYCRFEKFPFLPTTSTADATSASTAQSNLIQKDITSTHTQQNYAVPKTYEDMHSSASQYSPVIREGVSPVIMGTDGIVAGIQISLVPQRFVTQNTNPSSSFLAASAAEGNVVRNIDPSRASFTEPSHLTQLSQTGTSQMSHDQMHHSIPLGSAPSQPSRFSTVDANSILTQPSQTSTSQISQVHSIPLGSEPSQPSYRSTGLPRSVMWRQQSVSTENSLNTSQQMYTQVSPSDPSVTNGHINSMYQQSQKNVYPQMSTNSTPQYCATNRAGRSDYRETPYPSRLFQETQSFQTSISHSSALHNGNVSPNVVQSQYQFNPEVEVSTLPSYGQRSISSQSRANVNKSVAYSHSNSLNTGSGNYNYGDIPRGDGDTLLNSQLQYERSFGDTNQRTQAYSDPPVHLSRSSDQGSLTQNSIAKNVPSLGNGSNIQFQLPSQSVYMIESSYVEPGDNTNSRAVDAVMPICCHCRAADLGIFIPVPCGNVIEDKRVFCYPKSCPSNCLETKEPQETVELKKLLSSAPHGGRLPSHSLQPEQPEAMDYTLSNLPQVDTLQYLDEEPEPCTCSPEEFEDHNEDEVEHLTDDQITSSSINHILDNESGVPVTVMRTGECCPCRIPAPQRAALLKNAANFGDRVKPIDQPCVATSREAMYPQDYMKDVVGSGQVGDPPSSSSNLDKVLWALARVSIYNDGTKTFEILEASPIPPGHYFLPQNEE